MSCRKPRALFGHHEDVGAHQWTAGDLWCGSEQSQSHHHVPTSLLMAALPHRSHLELGEKWTISPTSHGTGSRVQLRAPGQQSRRGGGGGGRPGPQWLVLELGRVSLAAASSGHSPYLSEDFVTMETLMSSALQQPQPQLQLFSLFLPSPQPSLGFLFIYWRVSHRR